MSELASLFLVLNRFSLFFVSRDAQFDLQLFTLSCTSQLSGHLLSCLSLANHGVFEGFVLPVMLRGLSTKFASLSERTLHPGVAQVLARLASQLRKVLVLQI